MMTQVHDRFVSLWVLSAVMEGSKSGTVEAGAGAFRVSGMPNPRWNLGYLEWIREIMWD